MPELPEVERVRLSLLKPLLSRRVVGVRVLRADVVERCDAGGLAGAGDGDSNAGGGNEKDLPIALLLGARIASLMRRGKQLAIVAEPVGKKPGAGRCLCVHLGMTGSLVHEAAAIRAKSAALPPRPHTHLIWLLDDGSRLAFRDPRRFGGVWTFASLADLRERRWSRIGPDALAVEPAELLARLRRTSRGLKAALLDQSLVAGLGNIYVDELLFACAQHPRRGADRLKMNDVRALVTNMRQLLREAIEAGGSSLRDYVDGTGQAGGFQNRHQVYGRGGRPCARCGAHLRLSLIAGRTTVFCSRCQPYRQRGPLMKIDDISSSS